MDSIFRGAYTPETFYTSRIMNDTNQMGMYTRRPLIVAYSRAGEGCTEKKTSESVVQKNIDRVSTGYEDTSCFHKTNFHWEVGNLLISEKLI